MATLATESWTGSNGAAWPAQWTTNVPAGAAVDIQNNKGRIQSPATAYTRGARAFLSGMQQFANVEVLVDVSFNNPKIEQYPVIGIRCSGGVWPGGNDANMPKDGYLLELYPNSNSWEVKSGFSTNSISGTQIFAFTAGVTYRIRYSAVGSQVAVKIWDATQAEPAQYNWTATSVAESHRGGVILLSSSGASSTAAVMTLDNLVVTDMNVQTRAPIGDIGNWKQIYVEDFDANATTGTGAGSFQSVYANSWYNYTDGTSNQYWNTRVMTASNSMMVANIDTVNGFAGAFGAPAQVFTRLYGKFTYRFRVIGGDGSGQAAMIWPSSNTWSDGEIDFPEANFEKNFSAHDHIMYGPDLSVDQPYDCQTDFRDWHVASMEWTPTSVRHYVDDVFMTEVLHDIPMTNHRWTLQTAPNDYPQNLKTGTYYIDWATFYSYSAIAVETFISGAWGSSWTITNPTGASATVQAKTSLQSQRGVLTPPATTYNRGAQRAVLNNGVAATRDVELAFDFQVANLNEQYHYIALRSNNTFYSSGSLAGVPQTGFFLSLGVQQNTINLIRAYDGATLDTMAFTFAANTSYTVRFRAAGNQLAYRVFKTPITPLDNKQPAFVEPSTWQYNSATAGGADLTSGYVVLGAGNGNNTTGQTISFSSLHVAPATSATTTYATPVALSATGGLGVTAVAGTTSSSAVPLSATGTLTLTYPVVGTVALGGNGSLTAIVGADKSGITLGQAFETLLAGMTSTQQQATVTKISNTGTNWVRLNYTWTSGTDGTVRTSLPDSVMSMFISAKIQIAIVFNDGSGVANSATNGFAGAWMTSAVTHLNALGIHVFEVEDEPNIGANTVGGVASVTGYVALLQSAYNTIKTADPKSFVLMGGLGTYGTPVGGGTPQIQGNSYNPYDFLSLMYSNGAKGYFDAVNFHPYSAPLMPNDNSQFNTFGSLQLARNTMVANGDENKLVWITEFGEQTGTQASASQPSSGLWYDPTITTSGTVQQSDQAAYYTAGFGIAKSLPWVANCWWFDWQDSTNDGDYGLLDNTSTTKTAFNAFVSSTSNLVNLSATGGLSFTTSGVSYAIDPFTGANGSAWNARWTVTNPTGATATIQSNRGLLSPATGTYNRGAQRAVLTGMPTVKDTELSLDFQLNSLIEQYHQIGIRSNGTFYPSGASMNLQQTGFYIQLVPNQNKWAVTRAYDSLVLASFTTTTFVAGTTYGIRLRAVGTRLQARLWTGTEPTTWDYDDASAAGFDLTPGKVVLSVGNGGATTACPVSFDNVLVGDGTPPAAMDVATFSATGGLTTVSAFGYSATATFGATGALTTVGQVGNAPFAITPMFNTGDTAQASVAAGTALTLTKPANVVNGDMLVAYVQSQGIGTTAASGGIPAGWTAAHAPFASRAGGLYYKYITSASAETATTYTWNFVNSGRINGVMFRVVGASATNPIDVNGTELAQQTSTAAAVLPSVTTTGTNSLLLAMLYWNNSTTTTTTTYTVATGMTDGMTSVSPNTANLSGIDLQYQILGAPGATGTRTMTGTATPATSGGAMVAFNMSTAAVMAVPLGATGGLSVTTTAVVSSVPVALSATGTLTYTSLNNNFTDVATLGTTGSLTMDTYRGSTATAALSATGTLTAAFGIVYSYSPNFTATGSLTAVASAPQMIDIATFGTTGTLTPVTSTGYTGTAALSAAGSLSAIVTTPVAAFMSPANWPMEIMHRNAELDWPEETLYGYQQAAAWNKKAALEISAQQTSDGVWVCSHDQTTGRVFAGTSLDIPSNTWATLSTKVTKIGGYPIAKMNDILDAFPGRVFFVDDKNVVNISNFLDQLDAHGGNTVIIVKGYAGSMGYSDLAHARGYKTWGYFYHSDVANLTSYSTHWDLIGMGLDGENQSDWTAAKAVGKPVIAHTTISDAASRAVAVGYAANGFMNSKAIGVVPQTTVAVALGGTGTVTAVTAYGPQATATLGGSGTLSAAFATNPVAQINTSGTGTLSLVTSTRIITTVDFSAIGGLVGNVSALAFAAAIPFSTAGTLTTTVAPTAVNTVALGATGTLTTVQTALGYLATATLGGAGSLTAVPAPQAATTASLSGSGALTAVTIAGGSVPVALSGTGSLVAVANAMSQSNTASLTAAGSLAAIATPGAVTAAVLSSGGSLTSVVVPNAMATATFSGSGSLVAVVAQQYVGTAVLGATGSLVSTVVPAIINTASLGAAGTLATVVPVASTSGSAALAGAGTLTVTTGYGATGTATLTGSGSLTGVMGNMTVVTTAALIGAGSLTTVLYVGPNTAVALGATGSLTGSVVAGASASAALQGTGSLSATTYVTPITTVTLGAIGSLTGATALSVTNTVALGGTGTVASAAVSGGTGTASFGAAGSLVAIAGSILISAAVAMGAAGSLTTTRVATQGRTVQLYAVGSLVAFVNLPGRNVGHPPIKQSVIDSLWRSLE